MKTKIILASLAVLGSIELSAYTYEVNPLIGKNFTESGSLVDDSTAYGIRLNRYISDDNAIMFGYTRINDADYKRRKAASKAGRYNTSTNGTCTSNGTCGHEVPAPSTCNTGCGGNGNDNGTNNGTGNDTGSNNGAGNDTGSNNGAGNDTGSNNSAGNDTGSNNGAGNDTGSNNGTGNDTGSNNGAGNDTGSNNGTGTGGTTIPTPGTGITNLSNSSAGDTDINRFYINGLHNIHTRYSRLTPYVYGGFGYEHVSDELKDNDSQGFFNAGGGLKYNLTNRFNLLADVQGIKKFSNHDLDILGSIGIGFLFGNAFQPAPEAIVASGLEDVTPVAPVRKVTVVQVAPQPMAEPVIQEAIAPMGEYYVQMAAGFKTDMETGCKHTRDLRNAGIDYDIKYTTIRGKNAAIVVVGPYETKQEAKSHLKELRKYSKDAFVKRIKN